jgi:hypothetical protein
MVTWSVVEPLLNFCTLYKGNSNVVVVAFGH